MTGREWKPGDVAMVTYRGTEKRRATYHVSEWGVCEVPFWRFADGTLRIGNNGARRLTVIDPEDTEQVERLLRLYWVERNPDDEADVENYPAYLTDLATALREFANPTPVKPDEPSGLGAVVKDAYGREWVHFGNGCWIKGVPNAQLEQRSWAEIQDPRVVSEGVTP